MPHKVVRVPDALSAYKDAVDTGLFLIASGRFDLDELINDANIDGELVKHRFMISLDGLAFLDQILTSDSSATQQKAITAALLAVSCVDHLKNSNNEGESNEDENSNKTHGDTDSGDLLSGRSISGNTV